MGSCKNYQPFFVITGLLLCLVKETISASPVCAKTSPDWTANVPPEFSQTVKEILEHPTFVRRPKPQIVFIQTGFFGFFLRDWELAYRVARILGVKGYEVRKKEEGWTVILGPQTKVNVLPLSHQGTKGLFLAEGEHQGKMIRHIRLRALLLVEYEPAEGESSWKTISSTTVYIKMEQFLLAALIKITLPLVGEKIDRKLTAVLRDVQETSRKIHEDPESAWRSIERSSGFALEEKKALSQYFQSYPSS